MAIEATFSATDGEFPLAAVFSEFPAAEIELDRVVPTDEFVIQYFWVRDVEIEAISMENVTHRGIHDIRVGDTVEGAAFIRIDWDLGYESVLTAIIETDVNLLSAIGKDNQWSLELRADSQPVLADFQSYCRAHDIPLELTKLHALSPLESGQERSDRCTARSEDCRVHAMLLRVSAGGDSSGRSDRTGDFTGSCRISAAARNSTIDCKHTHARKIVA